jgi:hypothetical protein
MEPVFEEEDDDDDLTSMKIHYSTNKLKCIMIKDDVMHYSDVHLSSSIWRHRLCVRTSEPRSLARTLVSAFHHLYSGRTRFNWPEC